MEVKVNDQSTQMIFDTGSNALIIFRAAAERLKLKINDPEPKKELLPPLTDEYDISILGYSFKAPLNIWETPPGGDWEADGIFSWGDIKPNIFKLDTDKNRLYLTENIPSEALTWKNLPIRRDSKFLILDFPHDQENGGAIFIDTGVEFGVRLSSKNWKKWKEDHPKAPVTLEANYMPGAGLVINEVMWAETISIGPMELTNVNIQEANDEEVKNGGGKDFEMSISMEALKSLDVIIDGRGGHVYWSKKSSFLGNPSQNRSGMILAPRTLESNDLVAHVVKGSPADEAGIQTGDVVLKVNSQDITNWRSGNTVKFAPLAEQPAGTKIKLTLKREDKELEAVITLRDIFKPASIKP